MSVSYYNIYPTITPVRLCSTSNIVGQYLNGISGNGVGATLTIAASTLTIDGVLVSNNDRVILTAQTNSFENGIYTVAGVGTASVILTRAPDYQSVEQLLAGQSTSIGGGTGPLNNAGRTAVLIEPLPNYIGIDPFIFDLDITNNEIISGSFAAIYSLAIPATPVTIEYFIFNNIATLLLPTASNTAGSNNPIAITGFPVAMPSILIPTVATSQPLIVRTSATTCAFGNINALPATPGFSVYSDADVGAFTAAQTAGIGNGAGGCLFSYPLS